MQDNSRKYEVIIIKVNIFDRLMGKFTPFNVKTAVICENTSEEGSESKFGSEEGLNLFQTHLSICKLKIMRSAAIAIDN